ncbi:MAG: hypothetical protein JF886_16395 [Candidatus Dormibacteraeota bacterium]|uniref:Uncharacterized protein n=1 Tax=Candidatus Aeolococcus gillhamiae TaxID=3127015 RepID=A0A934K6C0_9BACT|nr:hypothetical protein [Candidatus Dormibacteraeota bacterium]
MAAMVWLLAVNLVIADFVPGYARALANVPLLGALSQATLGAAGLGSNDVKGTNVKGSFSGVTATVAGSYADALETVLFVDIEGLPVGHPGQPAPAISMGTIFVTDQFGQSYREVGGEGIGVGPYPIFFEPLRAAATHVGSARLTLHVPFNGPQGHPVGGIDLHTVVRPGGARSLSNPPSQTAAGTTYAIVDLRVSPRALQVRTHYQGAVVDAAVIASEKAQADAQNGKLPPGGEGATLPGVYLITPSGQVEIPTASPWRYYVLSHSPGAGGGRDAPLRSHRDWRLPNRRQQRRPDVEVARYRELVGERRGVSIHKP